MHILFFICALLFYSSAQAQSLPSVNGMQAAHDKWTRDQRTCAETPYVGELFQMLERTYTAGTDRAGTYDPRTPEQKAFKAACPRLLLDDQDASIQATEKYLEDMRRAVGPTGRRY
jgi:hypothetical protein